MSETNPAPAPSSDTPATGAQLPAGGGPAGEPANTPDSPAGPGKPLDGSPAVNTYTPPSVQAAEFEAGAQDWQTILQAPQADVKLPTSTPTPTSSPQPAVKTAPAGSDK